MVFRKIQTDKIIVVGTVQEINTFNNIVKNKSFEGDRG